MMLTLILLAAMSSVAGWLSVTVWYQRKRHRARVDQLRHYLHKQQLAADSMGRELDVWKTYEAQCCSIHGLAPALKRARHYEEYVRLPF